MTPAGWAWAPHVGPLAGAMAVALLAACTALALMQGLGGSERGGRWRRLGAAVALCCGVFSVHVIALLGAPPPGVAVHAGGALLAALALVVAAALAAQGLLRSRLQPLTRLAVAALLLGSGLGAAPVLAMLALQDAQPIAWNVAGIGAGWLAACLGAGTALVLDTAARLTAAAGRARALSLAAASVLAATIVGAEAVALASAQWPPAAAASPGQIAIDALRPLAVLGAPAVIVALLLAALAGGRLRTLLERARDELQRASTTDPLTGLSSRSRFEERLRRAVHRADRSDRHLALLFVNLDGLQGVNELAGRGAGDALLRNIGRRLRECYPSNLIARAGGDEFLLLFEDDPDAAAAARRAAALLDEVARPWRVGPREVTVSASIGIALYPDHGALSRLIPHAAAALHAAKQMGGATYCFFEAHMASGRREEVDLLRDLRSAIEQRELELVYQPKIHAPSGEITGAEALMRWHHPRRGIIGPKVFIPMAEQYGLIHALGNWAIDDACRQIRAWRNQGLRMRVAINLSVHQLRQPDLVATIVAALERNRLEPRLLTCEITETIAMDDSPGTLQVIEALAKVGVHLSIDDFGTGYSNLSRLRNLPVEELKIDRSFVLDLEASGNARAIVDAVVKLAQAIGLKVVAEGVETEQQQQILRQLGCDELQGFLYAKPMSARALAHWAMNHEGPRALDFRASLFGETRAVELA